MSRIITSPVKRWPGTVVLSDPLTFPQFEAWAHAIEAAQAYVLEHNNLAKQSAYDALLLPGLCACVVESKLSGLDRLTPDSFPATPRKSSAELIAWLTREINALMAEAEEIPNA